MPILSSLVECTTLAYRNVVERQFGEWDVVRQDQFFANDWAGGGFEILLCDGVPTGYARISVRGDHIEVDEVVILPEFQNRGIGRMSHSSWNCE